MTPPRLALALLDRLLRDPVREAVIGDLSEEFRRRAARDGAGAARRWFWRQAVASAAARGRARVWDTVRPATPGVRRTPARLLDAFRQDLRFTRRLIAASPVFAVAAVVTLAIGIGAATAIATAADRALLRPLPYRFGGRLVYMGDPNADGSIGNIGFDTFVDWRDRLKTIDQASIVHGWDPTLVGPDRAERLRGLRVSWNYFRMLGVTPALGRDFTEAEDHDKTWRVVLLSDALWRTRFGARPDAVGSTLNLNGHPYRIVGVLPASFEPLVSEHFYSRAGIWAPLGYEAGGPSSCRSCEHLKALGRLAPGATVDQARAELATVHAELRREHPSDYSAVAPGIDSLRDEIGASLRRPLELVMLAVAFVLLVACANVAGLLVARATGREAELALRAALGAGRGRLARQLLTESLVLAAAAAALGVGVARWGLALLAAHAPVSIPRLDAAAADPRVLLIGVGVAAAALAAFGLVPAWTSARGDLQLVLRQGRQSSTRRAVRAREALMVAEVAVALLLVATAGLMRQTVDRLLHVDPGFDARHVVVAGLSLVGPPWATDEAVRTFQGDLLHRVSTLPGVEHAALAGQVPLGDNYDRWALRVEGRTFASDADVPSAERYSVTPGYFAVMRIPLVRGRLIDDRDSTNAAPVVLVNETAARTLFGGSDPLGQRVRVGGPDRPWRAVVGIVGDVRHYALDRAPNPQFYTPQRQMTDSYLVLVMRTTMEPAAVVAAVRREVRAIAPDVPVYGTSTLEALVAGSVAPRRFVMALLGLFALATLLMAAIGLYGVVSQSVAARQREFGIRLALGARRGDIARLVLGRGFRLVLAGVLLGAAGAALLGQAIRGLLYDTPPFDPLVLGLAVAVLLLAALTAHLAPLRRATVVDPSVTLRGE